MPPKRFIPVDQMPAIGSSPGTTARGNPVLPMAASPSGPSTMPVPAVAPPGLPTAGTPTVGVKKYDRKQLQENWRHLSQRVMSYLLEDQRLETLLADTKLKDMAILLGISTEKMLLLEGQPTQIIGQPQQAKLDELGKALNEMLQQRGLAKQVKLTERTATIELGESK